MPMEDPHPKHTLLFDVTFLFDQYSFRGIGRYGKEVLKRLIPKLISEEKHNIHLLGYEDLSSALSKVGFSKLSIEEYQEKISYHSIGVSQFSSVKNLFRWDNNYGNVINEIAPDLFFATHFERGLPTVPYFAKKLIHVPRTIVVTHDIIPIALKSYSSKGPVQNFIKGLFYKFMFKGVQNADVVITSSEFSKEDLIKFGNVSSGKIKRIYLGVDKKFQKENYDFKEDENVEELKNLNLHLGEDYFLYDSGIEKNKGVNNLFKIVKKLKEYKVDNLPKSYVIVGKDFTQGRGANIKSNTDLGKDFLKKAKDLDILDQIITTGQISDEALVKLYMHAEGYIYLSEYEGFGLGPIQAMSAHVPTIVAKASCLPEVTKGGALLININEADESAESIANFFQDEARLHQTVEKGKEVAASYTWDKTVEEVLTVINKSL